MRNAITGIGQELDGVVSVDHQVAHIEGPADLAALEHVLPSLGCSIIVPRWGWIACDMPWAATISSISSSIAVV